MRLVALLALFFFFLIVGALWAFSSPPILAFNEPPAVIGVDTPVRLRLASPHGVRRLSAFIEQGGSRHPIYEASQPASRLLFWRNTNPPNEVTLNAGKKNAPGIQDGPARIIVEAVANDFRGKAATLAHDITINTKPPGIAADGAQHYINQGGSELVTLTPSGYVSESGVRAGKYRFRSFAVPGKPAERFALFAYPWDLAPDVAPVAYARNPSGAEATATFWFKVFPKKFRSRELELSDEFLTRVVNQLDPGGSGDNISRFLKINGDMRRRNNQTLADLRLKTEERFLWSGPFRQLGNSKVEAQFADARTYLYRGKEVDRQMHLGFDLSVVQNTPVVASNSGRVIFAEPLGIYGNCVVVDHGYGLQSIYAHLSQIQVKPGDAVAAGQALGKSGATGLAGGDHLHFSMQVDGVQVNPVEWWDEHWIKDRILSKVNVSQP